MPFPPSVEDQNLSRGRLRYTTGLIRDNWRKNYRHHGGAMAIARCLLGHVRLQSRRAPVPAPPGAVDCVSCSVIPRLTGLWAKLMERAIPGGAARLWIGDCSGGFRPEYALGAPVNVYGLVNFEHGRKVDLFLRHACQAEFVVISDDDVLWLDETPWRWAREEFARDESLAVVSLIPRERFTWEIDGRKYQPMGSYCLILRREIWLKEELSLKGVALPIQYAKENQDYYDTGDYANVELIKRGYRVLVAPEEIRGHLAAFKNISSSLLGIQKEQPAAFWRTRNMEQVLAASYLARGLSALCESLAPGGSADVVAPELLSKAERDLHAMVGEERAAAVRSSVESALESIRASLARDVAVSA